MHHEDAVEKNDLDAVKKQEKTGMDIFRRYCDMVFSDEDVSDEIVSFVEEYYKKDYLQDYIDGIGKEKVLSTTFLWEDYFTVEPSIDKVYINFLENQ